MRAVRMRGTFDNTFEEQITWLRAMDSNYRVLPRVIQVLQEIQDPLIVTLFAEQQYNYVQNWDTALWNAIPKIKQDADVLTVVPNGFSRLKPIKKIQVEWVPLHIDHKANFLDVVFPSHCLFGSRLGLLQMFQRLEDEWSEMPSKCFPLLAA